ncbi:hypothetical protein CapIbe_008584 [Capra ibex]
MGAARWITQYVAGQAIRRSCLLTAEGKHFKHSSCFVSRCTYYGRRCWYQSSSEIISVSKDLLQETSIF